MATNRLKNGIRRGNAFEIVVDGEKITAYEGETIAAALLASGRRTFRHTVKKNHPRGAYCGIGLCYECMVIVNGVPNIRACQTPATAGCQVETQKGLGRFDRVR